MPHKFKIGQTVQIHPAAGDHYAAREQHVVTKQLPMHDGERHYRIKSVNEPHERTARESELTRNEYMNFFGAIRYLESRRDCI